MEIRGKFLALVSLGFAATINISGCSSNPQQNALPADST